MDLSIVVVTYRSKDHVLDCLRSLAPALRGADSSGTAPVWECVVIDNDSRDGTPEAVERDANWARVIRTGANLGYAKAVNRGIAATAGASVLVTNPDCVWAPGAIRAMLAWLGGHSRCAIAARRRTRATATRSGFAMS